MADQMLWSCLTSPIHNLNDSKKPSYEVTMITMQYEFLHSWRKLNNRHSINKFTWYSLLVSSLSKYQLQYAGTPSRRVPNRTKRPSGIPLVSSAHLCSFYSDIIPSNQLKRFFVNEYVVGLLLATGRKRTHKAPQNVVWALNNITPL